MDGSPIDPYIFRTASFAKVSLSISLKMQVRFIGSIACSVFSMLTPLSLNFSSDSDCFGQTCSVVVVVITPSLPQDGDTAGTAI